MAGTTGAGELRMHRLRPLRKQQAMTQRDLAALAKVGYVTISRLERGETPLDAVRPSTIKKLAQALKVEVSVLTMCGPGPAEE